MNSDSHTLKSTNTIAYDKTLRENLEELHATLGEGITDIAGQAAQFTSEYKENAMRQLKFMSKLTADLSVSLIKAKGEKTLTPEEENQFESIRKFADSLGNLQFRINRLIMNITQMEAISEQISNEGQGLLDSIMDAQTNMRTILSDINALGFFSKDPAIAMLFENKKKN